MALSAEETTEITVRMISGEAYAGKIDTWMLHNYVHSGNNEGFLTIRNQYGPQHIIKSQILAIQEFVS